MLRRHNGCLRIAGHVVYGRYQYCNDQDIEIVKRESLSTLGIHNCQLHLPVLSVALPRPDCTCQVTQDCEESCAGFDNQIVTHSTHCIRGMSTASNPTITYSTMTQVITAMYSHPDPVLLTLAELDSIISQSIKSLDVADQVTRHSHAQLVGYILASTQIERVVPTQEALPKLSKKDLNQDVMDDDVDENNVTAEVVKPMLTPQEMLVHLSTHFNKPNVSRRTRIGIFDFYAALFTKLGAGFCETNFSLIVSHLLSEVISSPRFINYNPNVAASVMRYERLLVRSLFASCCGTWWG